MERVEIQPGSEPIVGVSILDEANVIEVGQLLNLMQEVDTQSPYDVKIQVIESYRGDSPADLAQNLAPDVMESNDIFYLMAEDSNVVEVITGDGVPDILTVAADDASYMLESVDATHTDAAEFLLGYTNSRDATIGQTSTSNIADVENDEGLTSPEGMLALFPAIVLAIVGIGMTVSLILPDKSNRTHGARALRREQKCE